MTSQREYIKPRSELVSEYPSKRPSFFHRNGLTCKAEPWSRYIDAPVGLMSVPAKDCCPMAENEHGITGYLTRNHRDSLALPKITAPRDPYCGTRLTSAGLTPRFKRLCPWWHNVEEELILTDICTMQCNGSLEADGLGQPVFKPRPDGTIDTTANLPKYLRDFSSYNKLTLPHPQRHFASMQSLEEMRNGSAVTYDRASMRGKKAFGKDPLGILLAADYIVRKCSELSHGVRLRPAIIRLPGVEAEHRCGHPMPCHVWLVTPAMAAAMRRDKRCQRLLADPAVLLGLKPGTRTEYSAAYNGILILPCSKLPIFSVEIDGIRHEFVRTLLLGSNALRAGYVDVHPGQRAVQLEQARAIAQNSFQVFDRIISSAHFGAKVLTDTDRKGRIIDRGRAVFDIHCEAFSEAGYSGSHYFA